jgi:hypothetical protein
MNQEDFRRIGSALALPRGRVTIEADDLARLKPSDRRMLLLHREETTGAPVVAAPVTQPPAPPAPPHDPAE